MSVISTEIAKIATNNYIRKYISTVYMQHIQYMYTPQIANVKSQPPLTLSHSTTKEDLQSLFPIVSSSLSTMVRGPPRKTLNQYQLVSMSSEGLSANGTAKILKRTALLICKFLQCINSYNSKFRIGRLRFLADR